MGKGINHTSNWISISRLFYPIVQQIEDNNCKVQTLVDSSLEDDFSFHTVEGWSNSDVKPNPDLKTQAGLKPFCL